MNHKQFLWFFFLDFFGCGGNDREALCIQQVQKKKKPLFTGDIDAHN